MTLIPRLLAASSLAALAGAGLLASDTRPSALQSLWASSPVIDGRAAEWTSLTPFESAHLAVGVSNDDRHVAVVVTSSDQARRRQLIGAGLIVWFDTGGGKKRAYGVRFPGEFGGGRPEFGGGRRGSGGSPHQGGIPRPTPPEGESSQAGSAEPHLPPITWFELMGPRDEDRRRLEQRAVTAIQLARDLHEGALVLELQVPLAKDPATGFGLGAEPGRVIGIGLETPELERPESSGPSRWGNGTRRVGGGGGGMGGGMGRGGMGGGGMGGRPDGPGGGDRPERAKPVKIWTTVKLATGS